MEDHAAQNMCISCNERMRVNMWPNKQLVQVLGSCPSGDVTPPGVLPKLVPSHMEIQFSN